MFSAQLSLVSFLKISWHIPIEHSIEVQLVGFSDASLKGYSTVVYMRLSYFSKLPSCFDMTVRIAEKLYFKQLFKHLCYPLNLK